ncbi:MAG: hypothetical protein JW704_08385, partial [Anaerolineaceae bacterium]|nr:hypothetical protein [Anaerolineaceae bacterium]
MKKNVIWIIVGVVSALLICCVGSIAIYFIYKWGGFSGKTVVPPADTFPTPNMTLTALYFPPTMSLPTATQQYIPPTYAYVTPSATNTLMPTFYFPTPGATDAPDGMRPAGLVDPPYLATAPNMDGVWDEWTSTQYPIHSLVYGSGDWESNNDLLGSYQVGWNSSYLFLAFKVHDDRYVQNATGDEIYLGDSLEILLDTNLGGDYLVTSLDGDDFQIGISPGRELPGENPEAYVWYPIGLRGSRSSIKVGAVGGAGLYRVEVAIP